MQRVQPALQSRKLALRVARRQQHVRRHVVEIADPAGGGFEAGLPRRECPVMTGKDLPSVLNRPDNQRVRRVKPRGQGRCDLVDHVLARQESWVSRMRDEFVEWQILRPRR